MDYVEYFLTFLNIEDDLLSFIKNLEYTKESSRIHSPRLSLLLLQTCPVIESYMVKLATQSKKVISSDLYSWKLNWKLWEKKKNERKVKEKNGIRSITGFPKFSYVCETVFGLSEQKARFYFTDKYYFLHGHTANLFTEVFQPYKSLSSFIDYSKVTDESSLFPLGLKTPKWWTAYNKVKHSLEYSRDYVQYQTVIEALSALFILLCHCDVDTLTLQNNAFLRKYGAGSMIKTKLFEYER